MFNTDGARLAVHGFSMDVGPRIWLLGNFRPLVRRTYRLDMEGDSNWSSVHAKGLGNIGCYRLNGVGGPLGVLQAAGAYTNIKLYRNSLSSAWSGKGRATIWQIATAICSEIRQGRAKPGPAISFADVVEAVQFLRRGPPRDGMELKVVPGGAGWIDPDSTEKWKPTHLRKPLAPPTAGQVLNALGEAGFANLPYWYGPGTGEWVEGLLRDYIAANLAASKDDAAIPVAANHPLFIQWSTARRPIPPRCRRTWRVGGTKVVLRPRSIYRIER